MSVCIPSHFTATISQPDVLFKKPRLSFFSPSVPSPHRRIWKHCMTDSGYLCLQVSPSERYKVTRSAVLPHSLPSDMITTLLRVSSRRRQLSICENAIPNYRAPAGNSELHCPTLGDVGQVSPVFMIRSDSSTTCTDPRAGSGSRHTLPVSISFTKVKEWGSTGTSPFPPACYVRTGEGRTQWGPTAPWSTYFLTSSFKKGVHRMGREKGRCSEILPITQPTPKQPCWSWKHSSSNLIPLESAHGK